jgi:HAD superfamily hydrolase (TIGR01662 family)
VFLDKDGTLVEDVPYNVDPALLRLARGAAAGLRVLQVAGFRLVVVTNQSGVARGYFPEERLAELRRGLHDLLANGGESEWRRGRLRRPDAVAPDLESAARLIVAAAP